MIETAIASETVGIEQQSFKLLGASLSLNNNKPVVDSLFEAELPTNVKPLYTDPTLQHLCKAASSRLFIAALPAEEVIQRRLDLALTKEKDIAAVLNFEAEPLLPFPVEEALIDKIILEKTSEGTKIQLYAAKKEDIKRILESWNVYQLDPEWICPAPLALAAFAHTVNLSTAPCFIVHLAHNRTTTCFLYGKTLLGAATTSSFTRENIQPQQDLMRILLSLSKQNPDLPPATISFVGELANKFNHSKAICSALQVKEVLPEGLGLDQTQLTSYALPIGSALLGLPIYQDIRINLRKEELAYPAPLKRYMKPIALYLGMCGTLALTFALLGKAYIANEQDNLRREYVSLLAQTGKTYDAMEEKMATAQVGYIEDPSDLTMEDLTHRLEALDQDIKAAPNLFPLQANTPQASDVLAWLSSHPIVIGGEEGGLTLESFSYTMVKRPEMKKAAEKYRVKIEIEFASPTPKIAREFHDALLAPNDFVDPKDEIKWSSNRGKYRASFFLKDKTNYRTQ